MKRMDARALLLAAAISLGAAVPAQAVYHLAGTFPLNPSTDNFRASAEEPSAAFAVDQQGNVFALNKTAPFITAYSATGQQLAEFGSADEVDEPKGIATDTSGGVYVADKYRVDGNGGGDGRVVVFNSAGGYQRAIRYEDTIYGRGAGFTVDGAGHVYLAEVDTQIIDSAGKATGKISYGRVDASDLGSIAGNPAGSGVYGRPNASLGEGFLRFDAAGTELGKVDSPHRSANTYQWYTDGLAADTKGNVIV